MAGIVRTGVLLDVPNNQSRSRTAGDGVSAPPTLLRVRGIEQQRGAGARSEI